MNRKDKKLRSNAKRTIAMMKQILMSLGATEEQAIVWIAKAAGVL